MTRATLTLLCAVVATAAMAKGQSAPAITIDGRAAANDTAGRVVLVLPIAPPPSGGNANVSQSIQQDLVADLTTLTGARVIAPVGAQPATNEQAALDDARQHNADFVVWGQSQVSGTQLRVTGQLLHVSDGHALAGLKATAPVDDLFPLEDSLAAQVAHALPAPIGLVTPPSQTQSPPEQGGSVSPPPTAPAPTADNGNPYYSYTETVPQTYYNYNTYYYPSYWSPYWGYPYWGYPYYWGGIGIGFYGGYWHHGWYGGHFYGHPYGFGFHGGGFHTGGFAARGGGFAGGHGGGGGGHR